MTTKNGDYSPLWDVQRREKMAKLGLTAIALLELGSGKLNISIDEYQDIYNIYNI